MSRIISIAPKMAPGKLLFGIFLSFSALSQADVDIKSGTFSITRADQSLDTELVGFDAARTYNSTVGHNGLFGKGWCSGFETRLSVIAAGQVIITECGAGAIKVFNSADFKPENIRQAAELIMSKMQKSGQNVRPEIKEEIIQNPVLREKLVLQYEVKFANSGTAYESVALPGNERVLVKNSIYVLKTSSGIEQHFDQKGRLTFQRQPLGDSIKLTYDAKGLKSVNSLRGAALSFKLDPNGYVSEMRGPAEVTRYTYSEDGYLTSVTQRDGKEIYAYSAGLLTEVNGPIEKTKVGYNPATRFVAKVEKNNCVVDYDYKIQKQVLKFDVSVKTACKKAKVNVAQFQFQYAKAADGSLFQKRMVATDDKGGLTSAEYAAEGRPTKIVRRGETYQFKYDGQNRLVGRETSAERIEYIYGSNGKMANAKVYAKQNKKSKSPVLQTFNYDKSERLNSVVLKDNIIKYSYDSKGRLNTIQSKRGPAFAIKHDPVSGRIIQIKAPKYGYFQIEYAANGKLIKNKWHGDIYQAIGILEQYQALRAPYEQSFDLGVIK